MGLSTGEHIRQAGFIPYFLGLDKPPGTLMTTVHGQSPAHSRNAIAKQAIDMDCTHVFFMDDDMAFPADTLTKLARHDVDIVTALYLMRSYPHFPVLFDETFDSGFNRHVFLTPDKQGLIPITNCGLGAVLINVEVFKKLEQPWVRLGEIVKDGWSDDMGFFNRAREAGFKLYCDLDALVGHMTSNIIWPVQYNGNWFSEYRNTAGNIVFPQMVPVDSKEEEKALA